MRNMLTVYTVGAIAGLTYDECFAAFNERVEKLRLMGYTVLHPIYDIEILKGEAILKSEGMSSPELCNHAITMTDFWYVDNADILFVDFTNATERPSIGSVAEISRAYAKGKLIVTVMQKQNIHRHAFILEMSSVVYESMEDAYAYFERKIESIYGANPGTKSRVH